MPNISNRSPRVVDRPNVDRMRATTPDTGVALSTWSTTSIRVSGAATRRTISAVDSVASTTSSRQYTGARTTTPTAIVLAMISRASSRAGYHFTSVKCRRLRQFTAAARRCRRQSPVVQPRSVSRCLMCVRLLPLALGVLWPAIAIAGPSEEELAFPPMGSRANDEQQLVAGIVHTPRLPRTEHAVRLLLSLLHDEGRVYELRQWVDRLADDPVITFRRVELATSLRELQLQFAREDVDELEREARRTNVRADSALRRQLRPPRHAPRERVGAQAVLARQPARSGSLQRRGVHGACGASRPRDDAVRRRVVRLARWSRAAAIRSPAGCAAADRSRAHPRATTRGDRAAAQGPRVQLPRRRDRRLTACIAAIESAVLSCTRT